MTPLRPRLSSALAAAGTRRPRGLSALLARCGGRFARVLTRPLSCLVLTCLILNSAGCSGSAVELEPAPSVLDRVAVVGASASAGFGIRVDGKLCDLAQVLDSCIDRPHTTPVSLGNSMMFLSPDEIAARQVRLALREEPQLILALDFLFWFGYGDLVPAETRAKRLERGLALIDRFECPVLISTLPDMSAAIGHMLMPSQVPSRSELAPLNARIREYAAASSSIHLMELPALLEELGTQGRVQLRSGLWPEATLPLLQDDHLHPNLPGLVAVCLRILWQLQQEGLIDTRDVRWDPDEVLATLGEGR